MSLYNAIYVTFSATSGLARLLPMDQLRREIVVLCMFSVLTALFHMIPWKEYQKCYQKDCLRLCESTFNVESCNQAKFLSTTPL